MKAFCCVAIAVSLALPCLAEDRDYTCFQSYSPYMPEIDSGADVAIVYGSPEFAERAALWREKGYVVSYMTGIAWAGGRAGCCADCGGGRAEIRHGNPSGTVRAGV